MQNEQNTEPQSKLCKQPPVNKSLQRNKFPLIPIFSTRPGPYIGIAHFCRYMFKFKVMNYITDIIMHLTLGIYFILPNGHSLIEFIVTIDHVNL